MTLRITNAELRGFHPGNTGLERSAADYIIREIESADYSRRIDEYKDTASFQIDNTGGEYSQNLQPGDRLEFFIDQGTEGRGYGEGGYGEGAYGSSSQRLWTGMIRPFTITDEIGVNSTISIEPESFAPAVMGIRNIYGVYENIRIDEIITDIIEKKCPELFISNLPDIPQTTSIFLHGKEVLKTVARLLRRANKVLTTQGRYVSAAEPRSIATSMELVQGETIGVIENQVNDDNLINDLRIEGGTGHAVEEDAQQTDHTQFVQISKQDPELFQIDMRKSSVERVLLYTALTGSGESFVARLQRDKNGSPIAINNTKSDIASVEVPPEEINDEAFTPFLFPEHTLPEPNPWLIIQTTGNQGQMIGTDDAGVPAVIPEYPYQIIIEKTADDSIDTYRRREDKLSDDSIGTFEAANAAGEQFLDHNNLPSEQIQTRIYQTENQNPHTLRPGDVVELDRPPARAVGRYAIYEMQDTFDSSTIETDITLIDIESL